MDTTPFPRQSTHQGTSIPGPAEQEDYLISGPSINTNSPITGPFSRTPPQTANSHQKDPVKQSKQSHIPTLRHPASSSYSPTANNSMNN